MADPEPENRKSTGTSDDGRSVLRVRGARKAYGDRVALDGVDLSIDAGRIVCLLGPNGAGKTTLLRSMCGRVRLDSGSVELFGESPLDNPRVRRHLGFVPQEIALYPDLTARENLEIFGGLMGLGRTEAVRSAESLLDTTRLAHRADDAVQTLSGGMKRRLNIAAGVVHRPKVLLLDEPTVGVDPAAREAIHDLLHELRDEGLAILLTTHDLDQAAELSDVIALLIGGLVRAVGPLSEHLEKVFGDTKEVIVALAEPPDASGRSLLDGEGFRASQSELVWTGRLTGGLGDLSALDAELRRSGLAVDELRVREPGLRGVFFHHAGREIDS
jgi:ABC-2 type transport system ATP-binding protein